jgi:hypothetical protein
MNVAYLKGLGFDDTVNALWHYDLNGNVYLYTEDKFYLLGIDFNNNPEFNLIDNEVLQDPVQENPVEYKKISELDHSLKKRILDEIEKSDSDQDETTQNYKTKSKCLYEDKFIVCEDALEETELDIDLDCPEFENANFTFFKKGNKEVMTLMKKGICIPSIHDTYVRSTDGNVIFSLQSDANNSYRVSVYNSGYSTFLELNIVGDEVKFFQLMYTVDEDDIIVIKTVPIGKRAI